MVFNWVESADGQPEKLIPQPKPVSHRIANIVIALPAIDFYTVGNDSEPRIFHHS
jgi:hypothetical protein